MKKNTCKMILDIFMFLSVILLFNKHTVNMKFHEIVGLLIILAFSFHIIINFPWVKGVSKKIFSNFIPIKTKLNYFINLLLLISFSAIGISGIMISKTIFTSINSPLFFWKPLHYFASAIVIILLGVHIGLHLDFIGSMMKKGIHLPSKVSSVLAAVIIILSCGFGLYNITSSNFPQWLSLPFSYGSNQHQGEHSGSSEIGKGNGKNGIGSGQGKRNNLNKENNVNGNNHSESINIVNIMTQGSKYGSMILSISFITYGIEKLIKSKRETK